MLRHVLGSPKHRCLIVMDGLDKSVFSPEDKKKLEKKGIPNTRGPAVNCTVLFAPRHWKVDLIQPKYSNNDIVVEILGLTDDVLNTIIQNVLVKFFKLNTQSPAYKTKVEALKSSYEIQNSNLQRKFQCWLRFPSY